MNNQDTIEILEELLNSVKTLGFRKTLNVLKIKKRKDSVEMDEYDKFIIGMIIKEFDITLDELLFGRYIRGEIKYAVGFSIYFLYESKTLGQIHKNIFKFKLNSNDNFYILDLGDDRTPSDRISKQRILNIFLHYKGII